jgi:two-component system nitrogen regulation sensor histidine kinase NtrY
LALRDTFRNRHKDGRWIVGGLIAVLMALSAIYYVIQRRVELPAEVAANRVLLLVIWYVNLVLILTILYVLFRNLFKLLIDRRNRQLGSKFGTRLVATYIGLALVPGLLLFLYGSELLQGWVDQWFNEPEIRQVLQQGHDVAQELNLLIERGRRRDARRVLSEIADFDLDNPRRRPQLTRRLRRHLTELELDFLGVYVGTDFVEAVLDSQSGLRDLPEPDRRFLLEALHDGEAIRVTGSAAGSGRLILAAVASDRPEPERRRLVVVGTMLAPLLTRDSAQLIESFQSYRQLEARKGEIEASYLLTFLMVTLLVLLGASWVGLYMARQLTVPIQALAEGTRRISDGELDYRVEVAAADELGVLVESFNRMTTELERSKQLLEESNRELVGANERLAEERAVIGAVLQSVAAGVISVGEDGSILTCNGAALEMLRQRADEVIGRTPAEAWQDEERAKLVALFAGDQDSSQASRQLRIVVGGAWKTLETKITTMRDPDGRERGRVMVMEDNTELIQAQQTAAWNEAARRIAHEIKNPLTPIKLAAERMQHRHRQGGGTELGKTVEEGVDIIVREVHAMQGMVDEFSRFARMPRPHPARVDLGPLAEETVQLYVGIKPGVEVGGEVEPPDASGWLDQEQIKRVLINLLDNALQATEPPGEVKVAFIRHDGHLSIRVSDTGPGIPPEAKSKLFLPYFSTKGRGTGLGLSIVHRIISDHHGTISVSDNLPHGTVFTIVLPQQ